MTGNDNSNDNSNSNIDKDKLDAPEGVVNSPKQDHNSSRTNAPQAKKSLKSSFPKFNIPKFGLPRVKLPKPKLSFPRINFLWFWLFVILISYICMGYFLSVLMTITLHKNLAIAGFIIMGLLPTITGFADYALMKWGYLLSGFLIVGGLIFFIKPKFYFIVLALMSWVGITAIAFMGESLLKQKHKFIIVILILTMPCVIGLGIGWKLWHLAATLLS